MAALRLTRIADQALPVPGADPWYVSAGDAAATVMTDFSERHSVTVAAGASLEAALDHMKHTGVRCAFVLDDAGQRVIGMITAYDIMGVRPMQIMQATEVSRSELSVRNLMRTLPECPLLTMADVARATAGDIMRLFDESGLTHIPVVESIDGGQHRLRGMFSAARLRRILRS
jgi:CBS-domain-containing membrane protein